MEERRKNERFDLRLPTRIRVLGEYQNRQPDEESAQQLYISRNISAGGAFFGPTKGLQEGTRVQLVMALSLEDEGSNQKSTSQIIVRGRVVRSDSAGMAICFDKRYKIEPLLNQF